MDRLLDETLDRRRSQLQRILTAVQEVQSEIEIEREQNPQVIGDEEESATTPDSMRSAIVSPIDNPSLPAERDNSNNNPPQVNGIDGIISSSNHVADDDDEGDGHRNGDDDENKQQSNEENSPQRQSQEVNVLDNATELDEEVEEVGELVADEVDEGELEDVE